MTELLYLGAAVLFIFCLKQLSSPRTARRGNMLASIGIVDAVMHVATLDMDDSGDTVGLPVAHVATENPGRRMAGGNPRNASDLGVARSRGEIVEGLQETSGRRVSIPPEMEDARDVRREVNDPDVAGAASFADRLIDDQFALDAQLAGDQEATDRPALGWQPEKRLPRTPWLPSSVDARVERYANLPRRGRSRPGRENEE